MCTYATGYATWYGIGYATVILPIRYTNLNPTPNTLAAVTNANTIKKDLRIRGNIIFRTDDGKAVALQQHHLYRYRVFNWDAILDEQNKEMSDLAWWCEHVRNCSVPLPRWRRYQQQKGLHDFNLTEYVAHIEIVKMPEELPKTGPCQYYYFAKECPIWKSHIQKLCCKHSIAAVSGKPPRWPGPQPVKKVKQTKAQFDKHGATVTTATIVCHKC